MANKPFVGDAIMSLFRDLRNLIKPLLGYSGYSGIIETIWERNDVYIKSGETKLYPRLVFEDMDNVGNPRLYYRIPIGFDLAKIHKCIPIIEGYIKYDVEEQLLRDHPKAHFAYTIKTQSNSSQG